MDIQPCIRELALFAGVGGGLLASKELGIRTICAVEIDPYAIGVLLARQNDGSLPAFPIWDDIRTFDGRPWRGIAEIVSGGFPCQDISSAGHGEGINGSRSGLWCQMARIIREVRPVLVFVENSAMLTARGLGVVLGDLASMGFDAEWCVLGANEVGASHRRERIWILAYADGEHVQTWLRDGKARQKQVWPRNKAKHFGAYRRVWLENMSGGPGMADGMADWMDRIRAIGNGQVPQCATEAFQRLCAQIPPSG